jgi:hypothetical protein
MNFSVEKDLGRSIGNPRALNISIRVKATARVEVVLGEKKVGW